MERPESLHSVEAQYGGGLRVALEVLSAAQLTWLRGLPHPEVVEVDGRRILLCHGAPWDTDQYVYPDSNESLLRRCAQGGYDWVVLGHTHYPMLRPCDHTTVVNPGSVGQPRNRRPGAHWALLDTESGTIEQRCETYDIQWVIDHSRALQPGMPYLWNVLTRT